MRWAVPALLAAGCIRVHPPADDSGTPPDWQVLVPADHETGRRPPPVGRAVQTGSGLLVWAPLRRGGPWQVQAQVGGVWIDVERVGGGALVVVDAAPDAHLRFASLDGSRAGPAFAAVAAALTLGPATVTVDGALVPALAGWAGGPDLLPLQLDAALSTSVELTAPADLPPIDLQVRVRFEDAEGAAVWLLPVCDASNCWSTTAVAWHGPFPAAAMPLGLPVQLTAPESASGQAVLVIELVALVDTQALVLESGTLDLYAAGGRWAWGDLHSHSNWSFDGCEDSDASCEPRWPRPAADWVAQAELRGLDFAALTDHAEPDHVYLDGLEGDGFDIWEGQGDVIAEGRLRQSEGANWVLPLSGYEWTATGYSTSGVPTGGHKTVVLAEARPCPFFRVAGKQLDGGIFTSERSDAVYVQSRTLQVERPAALWDALDMAPLRPDCAPSRWLSFYHHTAYQLPQWVDWSQNYAAPSRETLVEIYSEHGASECVDLDEATCAWRLNEGSGYHVEGSVQAALALGFQLGFVGGTDSHDARPGSLEDGGGAVAHWRDSDGDGEADAVIRQYTSGGLTGAWVALGLESPLDPDTLFDALEARHSAATSGPRPGVVAFAVDSAGGVHLPGAVLDPDLMPFALRLSMPDAEDVTVDRIDAAGIAAQVEGGSFAETWDGRSGEWTYLRVRIGAGDGEERVWLSPWFVDSAAEGRAAPSAQPTKRSASTAR